MELGLSGGGRRQVSPDWRFHTGDALWLKVRSPVSGWIYAVEQTAGYPPTLLLPGTAAGKNAHVNAGQMITLPSEELAFVFDRRTGDICVEIGFIPDPIVRSQYNLVGENNSKGLEVRRISNPTPLTSSGCTLTLHQID
jgi:hypothetical protein